MRGAFGEEKALLVVGHEPEIREQSLLALTEAQRLGFFHDLPGMTVQHRGEANEPVGGELPLAQFEVADLLIGRSNPRRQISEREPAVFAEGLEAISQGQALEPEYRSSQA